MKYLAKLRILFCALPAMLLLAGCPNTTSHSSSPNTDFTDTTITLSGTVTVLPDFIQQEGIRVTMYSRGESVSIGSAAVQNGAWSIETASFDTTTTVMFAVNYLDGSSWRSIETGVSRDAYKADISNITLDAIIPLTTDVWANGAITTGGDEQWYSFPVTGGTIYRLWWNEAGTINGDGSKTLDVKVTGVYYDGVSATPVLDEETAWGIVRTIVPTANGTAYLKVTGSSANGTGTYGIMFSSTTDIRPNPPFAPPASHIALIENEWKDDAITSGVREVWYSFPVTDGTPYYIWWNDSNQGEGKTVDVGVKGLYWDGSSVSSIEIFDKTDNGWITPRTYTPASNGTIYLSAAPYNTTVNGTFAIAFSTIYSRPLKPFNWSPPSTTFIPLTANTWANSTFTSGDTEQWYSFSVTGGTAYRIWWDESGSSGSNGKTGNVRVTGYYHDPSVAYQVFNDVDTGWITAAPSDTGYIPSGSGTIYLRVTPSSTGDYAIAFTTTANRPGIPWTPIPPSATPLTADTWANGTFTPGGDTEQWYSFAVTAGTTYRVWWNEVGSSYTGDGTKTADVRVDGWHYFADSGTANQILINVDIGWSNAQPIGGYAADVGGTLYLRVSSSGAGTYSIVFSAGENRPGVPWDAPVSAAALIADTWKDGAITAGGQEQWYSFPVTGGNTYRVWWNESGFNGNGDKTLDVKVSAWYSADAGIGNQIIADETGGWNTARPGNGTGYAADMNGTIYLKVTSYTGTATGTYGIVYSATSARPALIFVPPNPPIPLTNNVWADGTLTAATDAHWYSFPVIAGTTYRVWWNETGNSYAGDGTKTADIAVRGYGESDIIFGTSNTTIDTGWATPQTFTATLSGTAYLRVIPWDFEGDWIGTYGIVYSTGSTRPVVGGSGGDEWTVPAGLIGRWTSSQYDEEYTITSSTFSSGMPGYPGASYTGTIVNVRQDSTTEGYITIQYTYNAAYTASVGRFYVIRYQALNGPTVQLSGAYLGSDPDFDLSTGTGGKATQLDAESTLTAANGYFADYSTLSKQ